MYLWHLKKFISKGLFKNVDKNCVKHLKNVQIIIFALKGIKMAIGVGIFVGGQVDALAYDQEEEKWLHCRRSGWPWSRWSASSAFSITIRPIGWPHCRRATLAIDVVFTHFISLLFFISPWNESILLKIGTPTTNIILLYCEKFHIFSLALWKVRALSILSINLLISFYKIVFEKWIWHHQKVYFCTLFKI